MISLKNTLEAIKDKIVALEAKTPILEYVGTISLPYTATEDTSIIVAYVNPPRAGDSSLYIQASDNIQVFANYSVAMGYSVYALCVKGLTYSIAYSNNIGSPTYRLYRIKSGGGTT